MSEIENEEKPDVKFRPSFVLIAIDTHPSMFVKKCHEDGTVSHPFKDCLIACYKLADSLVFTTNRSSWSQFGVVLANDDSSKATFVEIENNLLDSVKILKQESQLTNEQLKEKYERQGDLDLSAFFLLCKKKLKDIKSDFYKRTIMYITNDDDPVKNDATKRFTAINEAKNFEASEIKFQLVTTSSDFNYNVFYNELFFVYSEPVLTEETCEDSDGLLDKLKTTIVKPFTKRKLAFYPLKNDRERYLKVIKVDFIRPAKLLNNAKVSRDGKMLKRAQNDDGTSNRNAKKLKIPNTSGFADDLLLDSNDKSDIYNNDFPLGFNLLYVSKRNTDVGCVLSPPSLLQVDPKEELPFFEQFWQYCVSNEKVLVCLRKYRSPEKTRLVELIPKYANNMKLFLIKHIPFCTEMKHPKNLNIEYPTFEFNERKNSCVKKLIEELSFDYDPIILQNPNYAKKRAYIKAKLLDEAQEEVHDVTLDTEEMDKTIERIVVDIKELFNLEEEMGKKRKASAPRGRAKRAK